MSDTKTQTSQSNKTRYLPWLIWFLGAFFYFYENLLQVSQGGMFQDLMRAFHKHTGAWIVVLVNPVAETHEAEGIVLVLRTLDHLADAVLGSDLVEHVEHRLVGPAMCGTPQRGNTGGDASEGVGARRACHAHCRGGRILLVIGVQNENPIHGA